MDYGKKRLRIIRIIKGIDKFNLKLLCIINNIMSVDYVRLLYKRYRC